MTNKQKIFIQSKRTQKEVELDDSNVVACAWSRVTGEQFTHQTPETTTASMFSLSVCGDFRIDKDMILSHVMAAADQMIFQHHIIECIDKSDADALYTPDQLMMFVVTSTYPNMDDDIDIEEDETGVPVNISEDGRTWELFMLALDRLIELGALIVIMDGEVVDYSDYCDFEMSFAEMNLNIKFRYSKDGADYGEKKASQTAYQHDAPQQIH